MTWPGRNGRNPEDKFVSYEQPPAWAIVHGKDARYGIRTTNDQLLGTRSTEACSQAMSNWPPGPMPGS